MEIEINYLKIMNKTLDGVKEVTKSRTDFLESIQNSNSLNSYERLLVMNLILKLEFDFCMNTLKNTENQIRKTKSINFDEYLEIFEKNYTLLSNIFENGNRK